jgi:amino acid transporter
MKWWPEGKEQTKLWTIQGISMIGIALALCGVGWIILNLIYSLNNIGSTLFGWAIFFVGIVIAFIANKLRKK